MTPDRPESAGPSPASAALRQTGGWVLRLVLWSAAIFAAALVGGPLALFGLAGVALLAALACIVLGATAWRAAALPLSLIAGALALTAGLVAAQPTRIARSHGLLIARPHGLYDTRASYHRGSGSVLVDLRRFNAPPGSINTIRAKSDTGRVTIALPRGRCFRIEATVRPPKRMLTGIAGTAVVLPAALGAIPDGNWGSDFSGAWQAVGDTMAPGAPSGLVAYGRTVVNPVANASASTSPTDQQAFTWYRPSSQPQNAVPTLRLMLTGREVYVRDYPDDVGPANTYWGPGEQVGDASWPATRRLPLNPGERSWALRWREHPATAAAARAQRAEWDRWYRELIPAAIAQARMAAGTCATRTTQAGYWATAWYGEENSRVTHAISVNGLGRVRVTRNGVTSATRPQDAARANPFLKAMAIQERSR